mmetsp:Transcript_21326/g.25400  ORF Transcript_21326/g.25400 Transcript_21326/m.25400 type:complete len:110 (+) Transcript_21326:457-786(+)
MKYCSTIVEEAIPFLRGIFSESCTCGDGGIVWLPLFLLGDSKQQSWSICPAPTNTIASILFMCLLDYIIAVDIISVAQYMFFFFLMLRVVPFYKYRRGRISLVRHIHLR